MTEWEAFIAWVEAPEAYNWLTLLGVLGGGMTAVFTGYSATTQWIDRRSKVSMEWFHSIVGENIELTCEITNRTKGTIIGDRIVVSGLSSDIRVRNDREKHHSWDRNVSHVNLKVAPGDAKTVTFIISPNPTDLRRSSKRYSSKLGAAATRFLWQRLQWKLLFGASLSIRLTLRRRASQIRPIRITHRIRIYADNAIQMAEKAEAKAAAK